MLLKNPALSVQNEVPLDYLRGEGGMALRLLEIPEEMIEATQALINDRTEENDDGQRD